MILPERRPLLRSTTAEVRLQRNMITRQASGDI